MGTFSSLPAEPERTDPKVGESQPSASLWIRDEAYNGPPEDGQPRAGSKDPGPEAKRQPDREEAEARVPPSKHPSLTQDDERLHQHGGDVAAPAPRR